MRLYSLQALLRGEQAGAQPAAVLRLPGKISCASWSPDAEGVITIGDYDGGLSQVGGWVAGWACVGRVWGQEARRVRSWGSRRRSRRRLLLGGPAPRAGLATPPDARPPPPPPPPRQVHVCSGHLLADLDAHAGRRVWGLAHSSRQPQLVASVSDDRTARLWRGPALAEAAMTIRPPTSAALCGVDFSASRDHLLALASSDASVYLYDIRQARAPLAALAAHRRPVSYVKFFGAGGLVSASTDATLAWWDVAALLGQESEGGQRGELDRQAQVQQQQQAQRGGGRPVLPAAERQESEQRERRVHRERRERRGRGADTDDDDDDEGDADEERRWAGRGGGRQCARGPGAGGSWPVLARPRKLFSGHANEKNFVGLAVRPEDGLVACGSETSEVFSWHTSWSQPLARWAGPGRGQGRGQKQGQAGLFVSAVAWQPAAAAERLGWPALLAAGTSDGDVELLALAAAG